VEESSEQVMSETGNFKEVSLSGLIDSMTLTSSMSSCVTEKSV
jgi:hypothetical protein